MAAEFAALPTSPSTTGSTVENAVNSSLSIEPAVQESTADQASFDMLMNSYEHNILSETFYNTEDKKKADVSNKSVDIGVARGLILNGVASSN